MDIKSWLSERQFVYTAAIGQAILECCMAWPPREGDHIPDVLQAGGKEHQALKAQTKPRVRDAAISTQVQIRLVVCEVQAMSLHPLFQQLHSMNDHSYFHVQMDTLDACMVTCAGGEPQLYINLYRRGSHNSTSTCTGGGATTLHQHVSCISQGHPPTLEHDPSAQAMETGQPFVRQLTSSLSSRWLPPMSSPTPGTRMSIAATVLPSSFMRM